MSMVLLAVLLTLIVAPAGACQLMCAAQHQAESARHCVQHIATMPQHSATVNHIATMTGMAPEHSRMNSPSVAITPVLARSCGIRCDAARVGAYPRLATQVTSVQTEVVVLETAAKPFANDPFANNPSASWRMDGTPPAFVSPSAASSSILRI